MAATGAGLEANLERAHNASLLGETQGLLMCLRLYASAFNQVPANIPLVNKMSSKTAKPAFQGLLGASDSDGADNPSNAIAVGGDQSRAFNDTLPEPVEVGFRDSAFMLIDLGRRGQKANPAAVATMDVGRFRGNRLAIERPAQVLQGAMVAAAGLTLSSGKYESIHAAPVLDSLRDLLMEAGITKFAKQCKDHVLEQVLELQNASVFRIPYVLTKETCYALEWYVAGSEALTAEVIQLIRALANGNQQAATLALVSMVEELEHAVERLFLGVAMVMHATAVATAGGKADPASVAQNLALVTMARAMMVHRVLPLGRIAPDRLLRLWKCVSNDETPLRWR